MFLLGELGSSREATSRSPCAVAPTMLPVRQWRPHERSGSLVTDNLTKDYGSFRAARGPQPVHSAGEVVGLLGPNGSGKSTALRLMLGFLQPTRGRAPSAVSTAGASVEARKRVAYLPGELRSTTPPGAGSSRSSRSARGDTPAEVDARQKARHRSTARSRTCPAAEAGRWLSAVLVPKVPLIILRRTDQHARPDDARRASGATADARTCAVRRCCSRRTCWTRSKRCATASRSCAGANSFTCRRCRRSVKGAVSHTVLTGPQPPPTPAPAAPNSANTVTADGPHSDDLRGPLRCCSTESWRSPLADP